MTPEEKDTWTLLVAKPTEAQIDQVRQWAQGLKDSGFWDDKKTKAADSQRPSTLGSYWRAARRRLRRWAEMVR